MAAPARVRRKLLGRGQFYFTCRGMLCQFLPPAGFFMYFLCADKESTKESRQRGRGFDSPSPLKTPTQRPRGAAPPIGFPRSLEVKLACASKAPLAQREVARSGAEGRRDRLSPRRREPPESPAERVSGGKGRRRKRTQSFRPLAGNGMERPPSDVGRRDRFL